MDGQNLTTMAVIKQTIVEVKDKYIGTEVSQAEGDHSSEVGHLEKF